MNPIDAYRDKIGMTLLNRLAQALRAGEIDRIELAEISTDILENLDKALTNVEILGYLEKLASEWPFLADLVTEEKKQEATLADQIKINEIGSLLNNESNTNNAAVTDISQGGQN
jgi:hypothetical protein